MEECIINITGLSDKRRREFTSLYTEMTGVDTFGSLSFYRYPREITETCGWTTTSEESFPDLPVISFDEWKYKLQQEEAKKGLPEKYVVDCRNIQGVEFKAAMPSPSNGVNPFRTHWNFVKINKGLIENYWDMDEPVFPELPIIPFNEWKEKINKQHKKETMEKKIIGYKLVKKEYEEAAVKIAYSKEAEVSSFTIHSQGYNFMKDSACAKELKKAGVLDLWFEPVYEDAIKIAGYEAKIGYEIVQFGTCQVFAKPELVTIHNLLTKKGITAKLTINGEEIKPEILKRILDEIDKHTK